MQARIAGDVDIRVVIHRDGSIESTELVSGPPLLRQVALESVQKSQFECRDCAEEKTAYSLTYKFELSNKDDCCRTEPGKVEVTQSPGQITVVAPPVCLCRPMPVLTKVRSIKCMYLWRCGVRSLRVE